MFSRYWHHLRYSPIDDGSGFIGVWWARHLDFGHGVTVQVLSISARRTLLLGGGIVIAVTARRLLRPDTATRPAIKRTTGYWRAHERGTAIDLVSPCREARSHVFHVVSFGISVPRNLHHAAQTLRANISRDTHIRTETRLSRDIYNQTG